MKFTGIIWLLFFFLLSAVACHYAATAEETEKVVLSSASPEQNFDDTEKEKPVSYGTESQTGRILSCVRHQWIQWRQHILSRTVAGMKRVIHYTSLWDTVLMQQQYTLFNRPFLFAEKPCSLYYVYAIRHILV